MSAENLIAAKYAQALLELAHAQGKADQVRADLQLAASGFGSGPGRDLLIHPLLPSARKIEAMRSLLQGRVLELTLTLLGLLIRKRRAGLLAEVALAYDAALERLHARAEAVLTTAIPLSDAQIGQLQQALTALTGKTVALRQVVDPGLLAGARIAIGDRILDGTLEGRLAQLRRALLGN